MSPLSQSSDRAVSPRCLRPEAPVVLDKAKEERSDVRFSLTLPIVTETKPDLLREGQLKENPQINVST